MTDESRLQGFAIITALKAGFLGTGRFGSGVVVARLPNGTWSAPSAIMLLSGGFGGAVGVELTEIVLILNTLDAVQTFAQAGTVTFGAEISMAAGPVGRDAEATGVASLGKATAVFGYNFSVGLFAGVSLNGGVMRARTNTNKKGYRREISAQAILRGEVPAPPGAHKLMQALSSRTFAGPMAPSDTVYNDTPIYDSAQEHVIWQGRTGSAYGEGVRTNRTGAISGGVGSNHMYRDNSQQQRATVWTNNNRNNNNTYSSPNTAADQAGKFDRIQQNQQSGRTKLGTGDNDSWVYSRDAKPARPTAPKPVFAKKSAGGPGQAVVKFSFDPVQPGDLGLKKGDIVTILKKTEKDSDWWTGRVDNREGIFPR